MTNPSEQAAAALLRWYADMGVDEAVAAAPVNFYSWRKPPPEKQHPTAQKNPSRREASPAFDSTPSAAPADEAIAAAKRIAAACDTFEALEEAVATFDGCPLKSGARNTVFTDGVPGADLLVIGEGPGRDEDRIGKPFVGRAGKLLDAMLAAIGRSRDEDTLISNAIFWRPPANRTPTQIETAICRPFVDRLIELTAPKAVLLTGGAPTQALLGLTGIMRARGVWREIETASGAHFAALPIFHPAFLLRQPSHKRLAWNDMLALKVWLTEH